MKALKLILECICYGKRIYCPYWCDPWRYGCRFWWINGKVKAVLPETCTIEKYDIQPIAFGLKKARVQIRYPEEWGGTDKLEELIGQVDGLQGIEGIAFSKA